ncbi:hypothetical protein [Xanthomonas sp. 10-10]|uniref:Uncharacterized protein n=1 Tax=Xanthomonas sp. 10-10 TaxID=3115848 RepID=A0AAU7PEY0_9XANT
MDLTADTEQGQRKQTQRPPVTTQEHARHRDATLGVESIAQKHMKFAMTRVPINATRSPSRRLSQR